MENTVENGAMFWLRCNKCYRLVKKSTRKFSLTQCQHLFCSECIVGVEKKCPECEALAVKTVPLAKPLQQPLLHYFGNVGILLQRAYEAAHFQRIQRDIVLRRFSEIQRKYEEIRITYCQGSEQMKSLVEAYGKLKEKHASIAADISKLRSNSPLTFRGRVKDPTNLNFIRETPDRRLQQSQHMMDYMTTNISSNHNGSRDNSGPSSLNSSHSSITPAFPQQYNRQPISTSLQEHPNRHPSQKHTLQTGYRNRSTTEGPEYRYTSNGQSLLLGYVPRVVASDVVTPPKDSRHLDGGWNASNRRLGSAGFSTDYSATGGTVRHTPMSIDDYSNYS